DANEATIARAIDVASEAGADILLTPEGSLSGYTHRFDQRATSEALVRITERARSRGLALALGTCWIESDGRCHNTLRFHDKEGTYLGCHDKTLRCGSMTEPTRGEIEHYSFRPLRTCEVDGIPVGGLICDDLWANPACTPMPDPHLTWELANRGVRVIFHAVNGGRGDDLLDPVHAAFHESNLRLRARAHGLWIVTVDNAHPVDRPPSSPGGVVAPDGSWAARCPAIGEHVFVHTIELAD
ncbi:MAG: carbon-nitrogen hydrolase family protein, partial [Armatimonadota bacterium]